MPELSVPSSLNDGEIKIYSFKNGKWVRKEGDRRRVRSEQQIVEKIEGMGDIEFTRTKPREGDWLIYRKHSTPIIVPKSDGSEIANVYYLGQSGKHWHRLIVNRRTGTRELLKTCLKTKPFSIVVSRGDEEPMMLYEPGENPIYLEDQHFIVMRVEDDQAAFPGEIDDPRSQLSLAADAPKNAEERELERTARELADESERYIKALTKPGFRAKFDRLRNRSDPERDNEIIQLVLKVLDEAVPTPSTSPITGITDYWSMINSIGDIDLNKKSESYFPVAADMDFDVGQVSSVLASAGSVVQYAREMRKLKNLSNTAAGTGTGDNQYRGQVNTTAGNAAMAIPKSVLNLVGAADLVVKQVGNPMWATAFQTVGKVAGPLGILVSAVTVVRTSRKAHRARRRRNKLHKHLKEMADTGQNEELRRCISFLFHKLQRRLIVQAEPATSATASVIGGSILFGLAITGSANLWNPVGWGIVAGGAAIGTGLLGYAIYRRLTRTHRRNRRLNKSSGKVVDTESAARELIRIALNFRLPTQREIARAVLAEFGVEDPDLLTRDDVRETAVALVQRHCSR